MTKSVMVGVYCNGPHCYEETCISYGNTIPNETALTKQLRIAGWSTDGWAHYCPQCAYKED